jgi:hypothetical protein
MAFEGSTSRSIEPVARARWQRPAGLWWLWPAIFLLLLHFGNSPSLDLDPTWSGVLRWAYVHGLQWGRDIIFTYGPLGFLTPQAAYFPGADHLFNLAQIFFALGQAFVIALALRAAPRWMALATVIVVVIWLPWVAGDAAWYATFAFAFAVVVNSAESVAPRRWGLWVVLGALLAAIALIKFTSAVIFALWTFSLAAWLLCRRRYVDAAAISAIATISYLTIWFASGQHAGGLFAYFATSLDIVAGYGPAMSQEPERRLEFAGVVAFVALMIALIWVARGQRSRLSAWLVFLFFGALSFIVWRAAFTRADHWQIFAVCVSLIPIAALCCEGQYRAAWGMDVAAGVVVLLSFSAFLASSVAMPGNIVPEAAASVRQNLRALGGLSRFERVREAEWEAFRAMIKLPRIAATVGRESVDVLMLDQGVALGLGLDYRPRPIFHSYQANTAETLRINEAHFAGDAAPRFVILKMQPIDGRYPMQEDGLALAMLLRRYRPRFVEAGYLLLERTSTSAVPITAPPDAAYRTLRLGESISLPKTDQPLLIFAEVQLSWLGRLRSFLLREPPLGLNVQTEAGEHRSFRLLRRGVQNGFVIAPLLLDALDWTRLSQATPDKRATQISIGPIDSSQAGMFVQDMRVALVPLAGPFAMEDRSAFEESQAYPGFSQSASDQSAVFDVVTERGHPVVFMHAPAWIKFRLEPGEYRVRGMMGLLERAASDASCVGGQADGVTATIDIEEAGTAPRTLWQARINPFAPAASNDEHQFAGGPFRVSQSAKLRIAFGMEGNSVCDWSYLRDLELESAP